MKSIQIKAQESNVDTNSTAYALQGSFVSEGSFKDGELQAMAMEWVDFEDDDDIVNEIVDEEIELLSKKQAPEESMAVDDDEEPEPDVEMLDAADELTHIEALGLIGQLEASLSSLGISDAGQVHLERFKREVLKSQASKKTKDSTIHSYFERAPKKKKTN